MGLIQHTKGCSGKLKSFAPPTNENEMLNLTSMFAAYNLDKAPKKPAKLPSRGKTLGVNK